MKLVLHCVAHGRLQNWQGVALVDAAVAKATSPQAEAHEEMSKEAQISLQDPREVPQSKTDPRRVKTAFHR